MSRDAPPEHLQVDGRRVELSRPDKLLFPGDGLTKRDLADYWQRVAPTALPHLRDRALTLRRFPDGIEGEGFFQKHAPDWCPDWVARATVSTAHGDIEQVVAADAATLAWLAGQAALELHVALARTDDPAHPDRLVFDLDPSDDDFAKVRRAAGLLLERLDALALPAFVQTTGSRGLHVVVPLARDHGFEETRDFAETLCGLLVGAEPDLLTLAQRRRDRGGRVYLDCLRNAHGQTAIAPYSPRALPGAPVATPLDRDELERADLHPRRFGIANLFRRLAQRECPWRNMDRHAAGLGEARRRLAAERR